MIEIKNPAQPPNKRKLTSDESEWHAEWAGQVATVETKAEALRLIGASVQQGNPNDVTTSNLSETL